MKNTEKSVSAGMLESGDAARPSERLAERNLMRKEEKTNTLCSK